MLKKGASRITCAGLLIIGIFLAISFPLRVTLAEDYYDRSYEWYYEGARCVTSLSIPKSLYNAYKSVSVADRIRNDPVDYSFLVTTQDNFLRGLAHSLHEFYNGIPGKRFETYDEVSLILAFVQSLPYTSDSVTTKYDEYPRFPIETLVDDGGDCEDTSILFAAIVLILNYDAIFISPPEHFAVGVLGKDLNGYYYTYNGKTYYYCETTGDNWKIGDIPTQYQDTTAYLYSIEEERQYTPGQSLPSQGVSNFGGQLIFVAAGAVIIVLVIIAILKTKKVRKAQTVQPPPPPPNL